MLDYTLFSYKNLIHRNFRTNSKLQVYSVQTESGDVRFEVCPVVGTRGEGACQAGHRHRNNPAPFDV